MTIESFDFLEGEVLLIDKPYGWTSFDVVNKMRCLMKYNLRIKKIKIGHAGTLDPLATGLLILCTGKFTKKIDTYQAAEKEYTGTFYIGATTPSSDLEKAVDKVFPIEHITSDMIKEAAVGLSGTYDQLPPLFSAKKLDGERAYEYARRGDDVVLEKKRISISTFEITGIELPHVHFRVVCSKGTYIRSLARDFGLALNSGAYLSALCRTRIGEFLLDNAQSLEAFEQMIKGDNLS